MSETNTSNLINHMLSRKTNILVVKRHKIIHKEDQLMVISTDEITHHGLKYIQVLKREWELEELQHKDPVHEYKTEKSKRLQQMKGNNKKDEEKIILNIIKSSRRSKLYK